MNIGHFRTISISFYTSSEVNASSLISLQKNNLIKNIEEFVFWTSDNDSLTIAKNQLMDQFMRLDIEIGGNGFFSINRSFSGEVICSIF